uniref:Immunoglobulin V-set domain-containing protein n=1 Tax=Sparus aurata TaxID=8175 RepID=A0A671TZQ1_SPAAU
FLLQLKYMFVLSGSSEDLVKPFKDSSLEDSTVTLSYTYSKQATAQEIFFWYQQYPGKPPEFLISHLGTQNETNKRLFATVSDDETKMHLQISSAAVTDSAVYYCALQPTFFDDSAVIVCISEGQEGEYWALVDNFVEWTGQNHLQLNINKTREMVIDFRKKRRTASQPLCIL